MTCQTCSYILYFKYCIKNVIETLVVNLKICLFGGSFEKHFCFMCKTVCFTSFLFFLGKISWRRRHFILYEKRYLSILGLKIFMEIDLGYSQDKFLNFNFQKLKFNPHLLFLTALKRAIHLNEICFVSLLYVKINMPLRL